LDHELHERDLVRGDEEQGLADRENPRPLRLPAQAVRVERDERREHHEPDRDYRKPQARQERARQRRIQRERDRQPNHCRQPVFGPLPVVGRAWGGFLHGCRR